MDNIVLRRSRIVVGLILVLAATMMFLRGEKSYATAGVVALVVLGLASIALSRRK